jgi:hypothetical protein
MEAYLPPLMTRIENPYASHAVPTRARARGAQVRKTLFETLRAAGSAPPPAAEGELAAAERLHAILSEQVFLTPPFQFT